ncbi:hypothetical protein HK101_009431 [Irineochytrium annulatum]|nr:hypothetical protein HK101_009431 [Irineochytrium annulatum]
MWNVPATRIMNSRTLLFPPDKEREFVNEYLAGTQGRLTMRRTFAIIAVAVTIMMLDGYIFEPEAVDNLQEFRAVGIVISATVFVLSIIGIVMTLTTPLYEWRDQFKRAGKSYNMSAPLVILLLCITFSLCITEEIVPWNRILDENVSNVGFFALALLFLNSFLARFCVIFPVILCFFGIAAAHCAVIAAFLGKSTAPLLFIAMLLPSCLALMLCWWRIRKMEQVIRRQFVSFKRMQYEMKRFEEEKMRVNRILEIMLPKSVIPKLVVPDSQFSTVSDKMDEAFCVFVDFFDFKELQMCEPRLLAANLIETFKTFDTILKGFPDVEKIKTITTKALLLLHLPQSDHEKSCDQLTDLAHTTISLMTRFGEAELLGIGQSLQHACLPHGGMPNRCIRIGIAFGAVVSGIIGESKFCYDIYGDTVNTASRMQTAAGLLGQVIATKEFYNVCSAKTSALKNPLNPFFPHVKAFSPPAESEWFNMGKHSVKGKGEMELYSLQVRERSPGEFSPRMLRSSSTRSRQDSISGGNAAPAPHNPVAFLKDMSFPELFSGEHNPFIKDESLLTHRTNATIHDIAGANLKRNHPSLVLKALSAARSPNAHSMGGGGGGDRGGGGSGHGGRRKQDSNFSVTRSIEEDQRVVTDEELFDPIVGDITPHVHEPYDAIYKILLNHVDMWRIVYKSPLIERRYRSKSVVDVIWKNERQMATGLLSMVLLFVLTVTMDAIASQLDYYLFIVAALIIIQFFVWIRFLLEKSRHLKRIKKGRRGDLEASKSHLPGPTMSVTGTMGAGGGGGGGAVTVRGMNAGAGEDEKIEETASYYLSLRSAVTYLLMIVPYFASVGLICFFSTYPYVYQASGAITISATVFGSLVESVELTFWARSIVLGLGLCMVIATQLLRGIVSHFEIINNIVMFAFCCTFCWRQMLDRRTNFVLNEAGKVCKAQTEEQMVLSARLLEVMVPRRVMIALLRDAKARGFIVEEFNVLTVLHLDVTSFTFLSSKISPDRLVGVINLIFSNFDEICTRNGVEKVITIGDAYIAARLKLNDEKNPLVPGEASSAALATCFVGLEMQEAMKRMTLGQLFQDLPGSALQVRVGIFTGKGSGFMTGGHTKMKYELFGDAAVNAEKVQENAVPGMVAIAKGTRNLIAQADAELETFLMSAWVGGEVYELRRKKKATIIRDRSVASISRLTKGVSKSKSLAEPYGGSLTPTNNMSLAPPLPHVEYVHEVVMDKEVVHRHPVLVEDGREAAGESTAGETAEEAAELTENQGMGCRFSKLRNGQRKVTPAPGPGDRKSMAATTASPVGSEGRSAASSPRGSAGNRLSESSSVKPGTVGSPRFSQLHAAYDPSAVLGANSAGASRPTTTGSMTEAPAAAGGTDATGTGSADGEGKAAASSAYMSYPSFSQEEGGSTNFSSSTLPQSPRALTKKQTVPASPSSPTIDTLIDSDREDDMVVRETSRTTGAGGRVPHQRAESFRSDDTGRAVWPRKRQMTSDNDAGTLVGGSRRLDAGGATAGAGHGRNVSIRSNVADYRVRIDSEHGCDDDEEEDDVSRRRSLDPNDEVPTKSAGRLGSDPGVNSKSAGRLGSDPGVNSSVRHYRSGSVLSGLPISEEEEPVQAGAVPRVDSKGIIGPGTLPSFALPPLKTASPTTSQPLHKSLARLAPIDARGATEEVA